MKFMRLLALTIIAAVVISGGCTGRSDTSVAQEWPFKITKAWEFQKIGENALLRPAEPRISDDGTLYFRDFERNLSYIIDGDGNTIGTFAPKGDKEGEVPFYINCFPAGDEAAICAMDKIHFFDKSGQFVKAVPNNLFVSFPLAFKNENEYWVAPGALGDSPESLAVITYVDLGSGEENTVYEFDRIDEEKNPTGGALIIGLTPQIKMGYDNLSNRIYFGKNSDSLIYKIDLNSGKIDSFSFGGTRLPISETDKRNHFAGFDIPEEAVASIVGSLPNRMTYYNQIRVINGMIYLFSNENIGHNLTKTNVGVYSPEGRRLYYGQIQVENGWHFSTPDNLQLGNGYIYAVLQNEAGDKKIVKYNVELPKS